MIKYIVEINGKFYIKRWDLIGTCIWDKDYKGGHWWFMYHQYGTPFYTKQEAVDAYRNRKPKFRGFL